MSYITSPIAMSYIPSPINPYPVYNIPCKFETVTKLSPFALPFTLGTDTILFFYPEQFCSCFESERNLYRHGSVVGHLIGLRSYFVLRNLYTIGYNTYLLLCHNASCPNTKTLRFSVSKKHAIFSRNCHRARNVVLWLSYDLFILSCLNELF